MTQNRGEFAPFEAKPDEGEGEGAEGIGVGCILDFHGVLDVQGSVLSHEGVKLPHGDVGLAGKGLTGTAAMWSPPGEFEGEVFFSRVCEFGGDVEVVVQGPVGPRFAVKVSPCSGFTRVRSFFGVAAWVAVEPGFAFR